MMKPSNNTTWTLVYTSQAKKDAKKVTPTNKDKLVKLLEVIAKDPFTNPPKYEPLKGILQGAYSRRTNIQHRLVYQVCKKEKTIKVLRVWTHYE